MDNYEDDRKTMREWGKYIDILIEELDVLRSTSMTLSRIISVVDSWYDTTLEIDPGCEEVDASALNAIHDIIAYANAQSTKGL